MGSQAYGDARVFLLIGHEGDLCLTATRDALTSRGAEAVIVGNPFAHPCRTTWRFDAAASASDFGVSRAEEIRSEGRRSIPEGVLVRGVAPAPPAQERWRTEDLAYNHSETEAAVLGWLAGLPCPVINRPVAWLWYRAMPPILAWGRLLAACGLPPLDSMISTDMDAIGARLQLHGGAAFEPLTGGGARHLADAADFERLARLAPLAPLRLTDLHGGAWRACVAGDAIVWDDGAPAAAKAHDHRLRAFADAAGLAFAEMVVAPGASSETGSVRAVEVEPQVRFRLFGPEAQAAIVSGLAERLLSGDRAAAPADWAISAERRQ